ncbi:MAG TPA: 5-formyltetrahydrofolate cyclo-ligase [Flavobacteriaceae bacterium]|nr:5-formyltetrahydrofolate cyclo-ligase [Flavobacteriaceae bacterium]
MNKQELRIHYKRKREKLTENEIAEKSLAIANNALKLPIWERSFYHLFLSISKLKEVETEFLLHILNGKDKQIVVSKSDFETQNLKHFLLTDSVSLEINAQGIPEPVENANAIEIPPEKIEVVFVPLLAFDKSGHRIGYGKGFYDRFLAECKPTTLKIGLSFFEAEEKLEEIFTTDVPLDFCVTPEKVYNFQE